MLAKRITLAAFAAFVLLAIPQAFKQNNKLLVDMPSVALATLN